MAVTTWTGLCRSGREIFIEISTRALMRIHRLLTSRLLTSNREVFNLDSEFKTCWGTHAIIQLRLLTWYNVFDEQDTYYYSEESGFKSWSVTEVYCLTFQRCWGLNTSYCPGRGESESYCVNKSIHESMVHQGRQRRIKNPISC
jgi:hypothetical protein